MTDIKVSATHDEFGPYVKGEYCPSCDWFRNPNGDMLWVGGRAYLAPDHADAGLCPECGSNTLRSVGRYTTKVTTTHYRAWYGVMKTRTVREPYVAFRPRVR